MKVYQDLVQKAATNDPSGEGRKTYREMHLQCDRIWVERIQLKKAELATLAAGARRDRNPEPAPIIFDAFNVRD